MRFSGSIGVLRYSLVRSDRTCSSPLQRWGFASRCAGNPASEDAGYSNHHDHEDANRAGSSLFS